MESPFGITETQSLSMRETVVLVHTYGYTNTFSYEGIVLYIDI